MFENIHVLYLSILQGLTEFLPVSSSGHLILFSKFTHFPDQGMELDVAVHFGSILAVMIYFSATIWQMVKGLLRTYLLPNFKDEDARTFWLLVIGTIPVVIVGLLLKTNGMEWLRNPKLIGWTILGYGLLLFIADNFSMTIKQIKHLRVRDAIIIGCAQCLALIPGTSRSGITITTARFLGLERRQAAKFSMLLSIPAIVGATTLVAWQTYKMGNIGAIAALFDGVVYSYITSIIAIYLVMWWLKKSTFLPFVIYRVLLGSYLLLDAYGYLN